MRELVPHPPLWQLDWQEISDRLPSIAALQDCPQDPHYHAEGDVWTHTRMVCEALVDSPEWRALATRARETVFAAALFHDIGKPQTTRLEQGRYRSPYHSRIGSIMVRRILWELDWPAEEREAVCGLVRHHMLPPRLWERDAPARVLHSVSQSARCDWLAMLAEADVEGRICNDKRELLDRVAFFSELAAEEQCLCEPRQFPSAHSRFRYFRNPGRDPNHEAFDDCRLTLWMLSGLPASGKDHWIRENKLGLPVISLDEIREQERISPVDDQSRVIARAREQARAHLRSGEDFIWNATNLSREIRRQVIDLAVYYQARIRIICVEAGYRQLLDRNRRRERAVPDAAIEKMLSRWEMPDLTEAHEVRVVQSGIPPRR